MICCRVAFCPTGKDHDDILAYAESVLGKGCVMEYECYDWNGRAQGKIGVMLVEVFWLGIT